MAQPRALIAGVIGAVLLFVGLFVNPFQFYRSYLWAYIFCVGLASGSLAWLMLQYLTGGAWGVVIRRPAEAAARTLPLLALMFLPIVIGIPNLYEWSHADKVQADEILQHKQRVSERAVLHRPRGALLRGLDSAFVAAQQMVRAGGPGRRSGLAQKMAAISGPGLIFWGFSVTFMSIDWMLSLNPHWFSTMFGLLIIAGQGLSSHGVPDHAHGGVCRARPPMNAVLTHRAPARSRQASARAGDGLGVLLVLAIPDHLGGQSAGRDPVVPGAACAGGWEYFALAAGVRPFRAAVRAAALARSSNAISSCCAASPIFILFMRLVDLYWVVAPEFRKGEFVHQLDGFRRAGRLGRASGWPTSSCNWRSGR